MRTFHHLKNAVKYRTFSKEKLIQIAQREYLDDFESRPIRESVKTKFGFLMYLNPGDFNISFSIDRFGYYRDERGLTDLFLSLLDSDSTVIDVGANIGWFTLLCAQRAKQVIAFEPETKNFEILKRSIEVNRFKNVKAFKLALADQERITLLSKSQNNAGAHSIVRQIGVEKEVIQTTTLDRFWPLAREIDLLKIDVEGAEPLVLEGARKLIESHLIKNIVMEWNPEVWNHESMELISNFRAVKVGTNDPFDFPNQRSNLHLLQRPENQPALFQNRDNDVLAQTYQMSVAQG